MGGIDYIHAAGIGCKIKGLHGHGLVRLNPL
jgi:hypothetical protein